MKKESRASELAFHYHNTGFHCAEAVSKAMIEVYGKNIHHYIPKIATAFGGGVGRTKQDICGALVGGMIAIGFLYGRSDPDTDWTTAADLAANLRNKFIRAHGTTHCGSLLKAFGPQDNMMRCKRLSGEVAGMLAYILKENRK